MTKATKLAAAPALVEAPAAAPAPAAQDADTPPDYAGVTVRDVYAAQALSAIVCGIVQRGGLAALHSTLDESGFMPTVFRLADDALQARDA